jgi:hypothetical protein
MNSIVLSNWGDPFNIMDVKKDLAVRGPAVRRVMETEDGRKAFSTVLESDSRSDIIAHLDANLEDGETPKGRDIATLKTWYLFSISGFRPKLMDAQASNWSLRRDVALSERTSRLRLM